jgi:hypothetical protein
MFMSIDFLSEEAIAESLAYRLQGLGVATEE